MHIVTDKNHSTLGIIDRFIRTLRDMNTLSEKSKHESHDEKYTFITPKRMEKFLNTYNNTCHTAIRCTPNEMLKDPEKEKKYISKCLEAAENQHKIKDLILPVGAYVRYILPRHDGITKKRFQISRECYKIDERKGNMYTLIAQDGTVMSKPRFKLILCSSDGSKPSNIKWASTIPGKWNGNVEKISSFNPKTNKYTVLFSVPGGKGSTRSMSASETYKDTIPASYLRGATPQIQSEVEKEYFEH
ncbi:Integrase core domain containing protein [Histomonas meleagridis]|uniref:Integrase core domain containing protein n=1 Tax=Histomonas meleagridis TaxID=135588 RepID=UPI0035595F95|nr:Integrase core domain containing protein [Histomonas meleagridis]KAH0798585.1 Integrase core domain containing protein [Histomonas meleagridis]